jgi:hypothetical protein
MEFIPMALRDLSGSLCKFTFKPSPYVLFILLVIGQKQSNRFLGAELGDSGEIPDTEAIQNFGALQFAFAQAQRAFDGFGRNW